MNPNPVTYLLDSYFERVKNPLVFQKNLSIILMDPVRMMVVRERLTIEKMTGNPRLTKILKELGNINMYKIMVRKHFPELFENEKNLKTTLPEEKPKIKIKGIIKWILS